MTASFVKDLDRKHKHETHKILTNISDKIVKPKRKYSCPFWQVNKYSVTNQVFFRTNNRNKQAMQIFANGPVWKTLQNKFSY